MFNKSFDILRANPKIILPYLIFTAVIGILAVYASLLLVGSASSTGVNTASSFLSLALGTLGRLVPLIVLIAALAILVIPLIIGAYISIADQGYQKKKVSLRIAFGVAKRNYLNMLLLSILVTIIWIAVFAVIGLAFVVPAFMLGRVGTALWLLLGMIVSIVVMVVLTLYLYEAYTVVILEKLGPIGAVRRSFQIGKQRLGLLFKVFALTILVAMGFVIVDSIAVIIIEIPLSLSGQMLLGIGIGQALNFLLSSAFSSWFIMISVAFYKEYVGKRKR